MYRVVGYEVTDTPFGLRAFTEEFKSSLTLANWLLQVCGPELRGHVLIEKCEWLLEGEER